MSGQETDPTLLGIDMSAVVTRAIGGITSREWVEIPCEADRLATLVEKARAGKEVEIPLISGIWTSADTPARERLIKRFSGSWAFSLDGWQAMMLELGKPLPGTRSEDLRDPATGRINNPHFIASLLRTGKAVEIGQRAHETEGQVLVNHVWELWLQGSADPYLPLATVRTVDAHAAEVVGFTQYRETGPTLLYTTQDVAVGEKFVLFPGLELPELSQAV